MLHQTGKIYNTVTEMQRLNINILGISNVQWSGCGECCTSDYYIYYSGTNNPQHRYGVTIIMTKHIKQSTINIVNLSNRVIYTTQNIHWQNKYHSQLTGATMKLKNSIANWIHYAKLQNTQTSILY